MSAQLFRLGRWCYQHRRVVVIVWVLAIVTLAVLAVNVKGSTNDSVTVPGTESQRALDLLDKQFPGTGGAQAQVVFSLSPLSSGRCSFPSLPSSATS